MRVSRLLGAATAVIVAAALLPASAAAGDSARAHGHRTPVVLFPAFHFTKLLVTVHDQVVAPGCPRSGTFQDWFLNDHPSPRFSQVCEDKLLTLRYDRRGNEPWRTGSRTRAASRCGSSTTARPRARRSTSRCTRRSRPTGYTRNKNIRVAGYDARLTPDMNGFRAPHQASDRDDVPPERPHARAPRRPLQRPALRAVPAHAHVARRGSTATSTDSRPSRATSPVRASSTRCCSRGSTSRTSPSRRPPRTPRSSARMYLTAPSSYMSAADPRIFGSTARPSCETRPPAAPTRLGTTGASSGTPGSAG